MVDNHCPPLSFHLRSGHCSFSLWGRCVWAEGEEVVWRAILTVRVQPVRTDWPSETDIRDGQKGWCGIQFWFLLPLKPSSTSALSTCPFHGHVTINRYLWWFAFFFCCKISYKLNWYCWCSSLIQHRYWHTLHWLTWNTDIWPASQSNYVEVRHIDEASLPLS